MVKPITSAELMAARPTFLDHPCEAWDQAIVRVQRLGPAEYVALTESYELLGDKPTQRQRYEWAVDVVANSVVDSEGTLQFSDPAARTWLSCEVAAVNELLRVAMRVSNLGTVAEEGAAPQKKST